MNVGGQENFYVNFIVMQKQMKDLKTQLAKEETQDSQSNTIKEKS